MTDVDQIADFMIPVPFDHEDDAIAKSIEMRKRAMEHLANDGVIVIFPSGKVASSDTMMGPVVEREWNPFTAKMIQRSNASVVPVFFPGANSRLYQIANEISGAILTKKEIFFSIKPFQIHDPIYFIFWDRRVHVIPWR